MTIDHTGIQVPKAQLAAVVAWHEKALAPLGYTKRLDYGVAIGLGFSEHDIPWWISGMDEEKSIPSHHAFRAKDRATVDAFYKAALEAGGTDNGAPGVRTMYHPNYYGAFVKDPAGNNIEAVCHLPEGREAQGGK